MAVFPDITTIVGRASEVIPLPTGFPWDQSNFPVNISLLDWGFGRVTGSAGFDPKISPAYILCLAGLRVYVSPTGTNGNDGLSAATPKRAIWNAQALLNASGAPGAIEIIGTGGLYDKDSNFSTGTSANQPTVDTAYIAKNGVVTSTTHSALTWAADPTYAHVSKATRSTVIRVVDSGHVDIDGLYPDFALVASLAICAVVPNSFYTDNVSIWVNRADGQLATAANTRAFLNVSNFRLTGASPKNLFFVGATEGDGFAIEGGFDGGIVVSMNAGTTPKILYAERGYSRYGGPTAGTTQGNCLTINSFKGLAMFSEWDASAGKTDGFNVHDGNFLGGCYFLTVNCTGRITGMSPAVSCNPWTLHEGVVAIDIAGKYGKGNGCNVHIINDSFAFMVGTSSAESKGDIVNGGSFRPCEFRTSDAAKMWLYQPRSMPTTAAAIAFQASDSSIIYRYNPWPYQGLDVVTGSAQIIDGEF